MKRIIRTTLKLGVIALAALLLAGCKTEQKEPIVIPEPPMGGGSSVSGGQGSGGSVVSDGNEVLWTQQQDRRTVRDWYNRAIDKTLNKLERDAAMQELSRAGRAGAYKGGVS